MPRHSLVLSLAALAVAACRTDSGRSPLEPVVATRAAVGNRAAANPGPAVEATPAAVAAAALASGCTFTAGTTTCVSYTTRDDTSSHQAYSGCLYGPTAIPSRRVRTFLDTYQVILATVTLQHGRHGRVYQVSTSTVSRTLVQSSLVSDVCMPPGA